MTLPKTTQEALRRIEVKSRYGNFIGGEFVAPTRGAYFQNTTPITGEVIGEVPRSTAEDVEYIAEVTPPIVERLRALSGPALGKSA